MVITTKQWITETRIRRICLISSCLTRLPSPSFRNQTHRHSTPTQTNFQTNPLTRLKMDSFLNNQSTLSILITITSNFLTVNRILCFLTINLMGSSKATLSKIPSYLSANLLKQQPTTSTTSFKPTELWSRDFRAPPLIPQWMCFSTNNTIKWSMKYKGKKKISKTPINRE